MKQIKIKKEFWDKIVSGEKKYEFRKLSKGLESETYTFVSIEYFSCPLFDIKKIKWDAEKGIDVYDHPHCKYWVGTDKGTYCMECNKHFTSPKEIFGTAKLRAATLCNPMNKDMSFWYEEGDDDNRIDKGTYDFVKENYIDEEIDFIAYQISEVKNVN